MLIFVTGKSGSGKSTFSKLLAQKLNYEHVDIDKIGHSIYKHSCVLNGVKGIFGNGIFDTSGNFDRKKLGQILFSEKNGNKIKQFNNLTFEFMKKEIDKKLAKNSILDWALLPITDYWELDAVKILIRAKNDNYRIEKIKQRDNVSAEYIEKRESSEIKYNLNEFDYIIENDYTGAYLNSIENIIKYIKRGSL